MTLLSWNCTRLVLNHLFGVAITYITHRTSVSGLPMVHHQPLVLLVYNTLGWQDWQQAPITLFVLLLGPKVIHYPPQPPKVLEVQKRRPHLCAEEEATPMPQGHLRPLLYNTNTASMSSLASDACDDSVLSQVSLQPCGMRYRLSWCKWDCSSCSALDPTAILHSLSPGHCECTGGTGSTLRET